MVKRSTWWATAVGTAVGTGGWLLGIGRFVSPAHSGWGLFWITLAATVLTQILVEQEIHRRILRAQDARPSGYPRPPEL